MPFIGKQSTSNSQITNYTTTVGSGGQTNFTVVIEGGDETHVYLNGVLLKETTDYTVSSTQVILVSPAVENDVVEIKVFRSFALVDAVRASDGGTFSGDVTVPNLTLSSNVIKASDGGSTITLDDSDNVTIAGNLKTDTIAEKTSATGVSIDGLTIKDSGVVLGSDADGDIYYRGSGSLARLAKGTSSQILTMNPGGTAPEWATVDSAALVHLTTVTATDQSSIAIENNFNNTDYYSYIVEGYLKPTTDDRHIYGELGYGGISTTWITSSYRTSIWRTYYGSSSGTHHVTLTTIAFKTSNIGSASSDPGLVITFEIPKPYNTTQYKLCSMRYQSWEANNHIKDGIGGTTWEGGANAITAIKFYAHDWSGGGSHGNVTGELRLYGLKAT